MYMAVLDPIWGPYMRDPMMLDPFLETPTWALLELFICV